MNRKLTRILSRTFFCLSAASPLLAFDSTLAQTAPASGNGLTVHALLAQAEATSAPSVQQVGYTDSDHGPGGSGNSTLSPLVPRIPSPPKYRPTPLLPSIAAASPAPAQVPIVSAIDVPLPNVGNSNASGVPIVTGAPIRTTPDTANKPGPVVPGSVVSGSGANRRFNTPTETTGVPIVQAASPLAIPSTPISKSTSPISKSTTQGQSNTTGSPAISGNISPTMQTRNNGSGAKPSIPYIAPDFVIPSDPNAIEVSEISTDELMQMVMGFPDSSSAGSGVTGQGRTSASSVSSGQRMQNIGSGMPNYDYASPVPALKVSSPQEVFAPANSFNAPPSLVTGLNQDNYTRPTMPQMLPYDGYGSVSGATGYAFVDFLYMDRNRGDFSASVLPANDQYDFTPGARFVFGRRTDSIEGWQAAFTILDAHTANTQVLSPAGILSPRFAPTGGFNPAAISSFNGATFHENFQKSHYYSLELNRMSWNWDVMSTFIGLRYTGIDDLYGLNAIGRDGTFGTYRLRARNHLIGPQVGGELFYDVGRRISFSAAGKLGGYLNFYQTNTEYANANVRILDNTDDDTDFTWGTELGVFAHYMISPRAKLKAGYEFWYFDNIASAQGQFTGNISPFSGTQSNNNDHALYHGVSLGFEWYR